MSYLGHYATGATVNAYFLTVSSSGEPAPSTSVAIQIYRDATTERTTEGITLTAAHGGTTGSHMLAVAMASTFYSSGDYFARISAGTVDSRQLTGYPVAAWSVRHTNRISNVHMWSGSTVASPSVAGVPEVDLTHIQGTSSGSTAIWIAARSDVTQWNGSAVATPTVAGVPEVDVTHWSGSNVGALSSGAVPANIQQVNGSTVGSTATIIGVSTGATITSVQSVSSTVAANVVQWGGSTVGAISSGAVPANVQQVNGSTSGSTATIIGARLTATGVDDIWDEIVDGTSMTGRQSLRLANSANAGLTSGAGTTGFNIRDIDNTVNRVAATVSTGNRTAVTLNVSS